jgi:SOS-response transcriptional repressor LexA
MSAKKPLSLKQHALLVYIKNYKNQYGLMPTVQEMADHFDRSKTTIHEHICKLVKKRHLKRYENLSRGLEIL